MVAVSVANRAPLCVDRTQQYEMLQGWKRRNPRKSHQKLDLAETYREQRPLATPHDGS